MCRKREGCEEKKNMLKFILIFCDIKFCKCLLNVLGRKEYVKCKRHLSTKK